jgi:hypothetical protein
VYIIHYYDFKSWESQEKGTGNKGGFPIPVIEKFLMMFLPLSKI